MRTYCDYCRKETDYCVDSRNAVYNVKGEEIAIVAEVCTCSECGRELWVSEVDNNNLVNAYNIYRNNHNMLLPEQIKSIREHYNMSQTAFARLLGFGDKTIARYESGSIADEAPNNLLMLVKNEYNFRLLFEKNRHKLSEAEQEKVKEALDEASEYYLTLNEYEYSGWKDSSGYTDLKEVFAS